MAAFTASVASQLRTSLASVVSISEFEGLKASTGCSQVQRVAVLQKLSPIRSKGALGARCYIGSPTNVIVVASTTAFIFAGRFGLAPSSNRKSTPGLKLVDRDSGLRSGDPANFTIADTLAFGALGHIVAVGIVLGLKATGGL